MSTEQAQFLPFNAINLFMRNDFRSEVVKTALMTIPQASKAVQRRFDSLTKQWASIPGFRNSVQAPLGLKIKSFTTAFEKSPEVATFVLQQWADHNADLRQKVYDFLVERHWELLPVEADRSKLPGFIPTWPEGEDFEKLYTAFTTRYAEIEASQDDVSLMVVWLSTRLPYQ